MTLKVIEPTNDTNPPPAAPSDNAPTRSRSRTRSRSSSRERSRSYSGSRHSSRSYSRSRSRSRSNHRRRRSRSYTRSRSRSRGSRSYSRSYSRSSSRSDDDGPRHQTLSPASLLSRSRSHSKESSLTDTTVSEKKKDPRDRSKRDRWENAAWIVGEKVKDLTFHICDICNKPIVIYGRLMPCKHVYCFPCASGLSGICQRCKKPIGSLDRCMLGGIFMCFEDKRTYLSQRDLQAHMDHRHKPRVAPTPVSAPFSASYSSTGAAPINAIWPSPSSTLPQPPPVPIPTMFQQQPIRLSQQQQQIRLPQQQNPPQPPGPQQTAMLFNQAASFMLSTGSRLPAFQPNMPPPGLSGVPPPHQSSQATKRSLLPGGPPQSSAAAIAVLAAAIQANSGGMGGLSAVSSLCTPVRTMHHSLGQSPNMWSGLPSIPHSQNPQNRGPPPL